MSRDRAALPLRIAPLLPALLLALCGCAGSSSAAPIQSRARDSSTATSQTSKSTRSAGTAAARVTLTEWPEFGLNAQRSDATESSTGITAANVADLQEKSISLPGTVDSSPIYLHDVTAAGFSGDVIVVTTTYGRTIAIAASTGRILWVFTPPGYSSWAGTPQITVASPIADPDRLYVYATSPDGLIHKLSLASGDEDTAGAWPVSVTRDPKHEKLGSALNIDGPDLIATTSGYIGDIPTYQGHVVAISRSSGSIQAVFNTLCANRRSIITPTSCEESDSAILSRGGAVIEPGGRRLLIDTGNASWNGTSDFGDSVLELSFPDLALRQAFTPTDQETLNTSDLDLGSSAPALLGQDRVLVAGKDGVLRVLDLARLDGHPPAAREKLGGEVQTLKTPGGNELFTVPAVWHHGSRTTVFIADGSGTAAYSVRAGRVHLLWESPTPGTSPVLAGGLLYVYDPAGGIEVYRPGSPRPIADLAGGSGHWNSPIVAGGHVVEPEGNANEHLLTGRLELFSLR